MVTQQDFNRLSAEGYTHIPVVREIAVGRETPISTYRKLANDSYSYLFESASGGGRWGRYSIIGLACTDRIEVRGQNVRLYHGDDTTESVECDDPLEWLDHFLSGFRIPQMDNLPRFTGGLVGYFGYDTVRYIEPSLMTGRKPDMIDVPDILLMVSQELAVFNREENKLHLIVQTEVRKENAYIRACARLDELSAHLNDEPPASPTHVSATLAENDFSSSFSKDAFMQAVETARCYITDGDVMQVVLSQCLHAPFTQHPLNLYCVLSRLNPSPYMYCLHLDDFHIVGSSPEILVRMEGDEVIVRPIAGTRPRGETPQEDARFAADLLSDEKELAEHLMLIDLGRNDLGRVCQTNSVKVTENMVIERYSHVMHIVSHIIGRNTPDKSALDVLRATFPAGTVSGAPKVRAMELIDEIEPVKRHVYSGAIGYLSWSGALNTAIAIRTALIKNDRLYIQAGAGLVYDSQAEAEWQETMNKARAIIRSAIIASGDEY